jgi:hypothetical protein
MIRHPKLRNPVPSLYPIVGIFWFPLSFRRARDGPANRFPRPGLYFSHPRASYQKNEADDDDDDDVLPKEIPVVVLLLFIHVAGFFFGGSALRYQNSPSPGIPYPPFFSFPGERAELYVSLVVIVVVVVASAILSDLRGWKGGHSTALLLRGKQQKEKFCHGRAGNKVKYTRKMIPSSGEGMT